MCLAFCLSNFAAVYVVTAPINLRGAYIAWSMRVHLEHQLFEGVHLHIVLCFGVFSWYIFMVYVMCSRYISWFMVTCSSYKLRGVWFFMVDQWAFFPLCLCASMGGCSQRLPSRNTKSYLNKHTGSLWQEWPQAAKLQF